MMGVKEFLILPCLTGTQDEGNDTSLGPLKQKVPMIQPLYNTKQTRTS